MLFRSDGGPAAIGNSEQSYSPIALGDGFYNFLALVSRTIVHNNYLKVLVGLAKNRSDRLADVLLGIVQWDDNRNKWLTVCPAIVAIGKHFVFLKSIGDT